MPQQHHEVMGTVVLAQAVHAPVAAAGRLRVLVEEVSRADAAATVVARLDLPLPAGLQAGQELAFKLRTPLPAPGQQHSLRVHLDSNGSGRIEPGDQISTQSYPVAGALAAAPSRVKLTAV